MKKVFIILCICALIIPLGMPALFAAESTFQTSLTIIPDDNFDPSIPANLVATAVSSSQINLVWDPSTDDYLVSGYRIFRDGFIIASTTATSYSDTGLSPLTEYDYTVEAFDTVFHYSGQSAVASATTLAAPVTPPDGGGNPTTGTQLLLITNLTTDPAQYDALLNFFTNQSAQVKVYWGTTQDYELGSISAILPSLTHSVKIDSLQPDTIYFYRIEAVNQAGKTAFIESTFTTEKVFAEPLLTNVTDFRATPRDASIALTWNNPVSPDFDSVRLVRSDKFFPRDIFDGEVIYEGSGEKFDDEDVVPGVMYYYSLFAKGTDGTYSSGALAQARIAPVGEPSGQATTTDPFAGIPILDNVHPEIAKLTLADFDFIQSGAKLELRFGKVEIDGGKNLTISLAYNKVPEILKTIAITLVDPEDHTQIFPFLLRINKQKSAYEATIAPLGKSGIYPLKIIVLDFKNQGLKKLEGSLEAFLGVSQGIVRQRVSQEACLMLFLLLILAVLVLWASHRASRKNEYEA